MTGVDTDMAGAPGMKEVTQKFQLYRSCMNTVWIRSSLFHVVSPNLDTRSWIFASQFCVRKILELAVLALDKEYVGRHSQPKWQCYFGSSLCDLSEIWKTLCDSSLSLPSPCPNLRSRSLWSQTKMLVGRLDREESIALFAKFCDVPKISALEAASLAMDLSWEEACWALHVQILPRNRAGVQPWFRLPQGQPAADHRWASRGPLQPVDPYDQEGQAHLWSAAGFSCSSTRWAFGRRATLPFQWSWCSWTVDLEVDFEQSWVGQLAISCNT